MHRTPLKLTAAVLGSALLVLTHAAPAQAATVVWTGVPDDWTVYDALCDGTQDVSAGSVTTVAGPASPAPPLGEGSMRFRQVAPEGVIGLSRPVASVAGISEFGVSFHDPAGGTHALVVLSDGDNMWQGVTALGAAPGWKTVDLLAPTYTWTNSANSSAPPTTATIDEFIADHGDDNGFLLLGRMGCFGAAPGDAFIDGLTFGSNGDSTTYDFEQGTARPTVTISVKDDTIRGGDDVVVTGKVDPALPGEKVLLKRKTAKGAKKIGTGVVTKNGSYKIVKELDAKGTYKLFTAVPATETTRAAKSKVVEVTVRR